MRTREMITSLLENGFERREILLDGASIGGELRVGHRWQSEQGEDDLATVTVLHHTKRDADDIATSKRHFVIDDAEGIALGETHLDRPGVAGTLSDPYAAGAL